MELRPGARGFSSDNYAGVHPELLAAIARANVGHAAAYGADPWSASAVAAFRRELGEDVEVFFAFNGTGANVVGLQALLRPWEAVICAESAHINTDECGAPERFLGGKLLPLPSPDGKLTPALVERHAWGWGDEHRAQPRVVSVTQSTEFGTVYSLAELRALADFAHERGMRLHVDGARIANAVAALGAGLREATRDCGVDVLSFGGTKNGLLVGEAIVLFDPADAADLKLIRKQAMQLNSKMRFVAAQFEALLTDELWRRNAANANAMAARLAAAVGAIEGVRLTQAVQANGVFAVLPRTVTERLQRDWLFHYWNEATGEVRWMCAWDTTEADVDAFAAAIAAAMAEHG